MKHLFIGIPNYSGSTLVHNLVAGCGNVATLRREPGVTRDFVEGNGLDVKSYKYKHNSQLYTQELKEALKISSNHDWKSIKDTWTREWLKKEDATVYLQKTPMDIFRMEQMQQEFEDLKWIIAVKEPYAYIESLFRRYSLLRINKPLDNIQKLCEHVILVLETQLENIELLGKNAYTMTMEDFYTSQNCHVNEIKKFTEGLIDIDLSKQVWVKGQTSGGITNKNEEKIQKLIKFFPDIIGKINEYFIPHEKLFNQWGYEIRL